MKHKEYKRIVAGAKYAVLFVHGILGTPDHFSELLPLVPESMSVYNVLLDGHGGSVSDFSNTSMTKWEMQIESVVNEILEIHDEVFVVAHSLGTLLTLEQAAKHRRITKMFLMQSPLKLFVKPILFVNVLKVYTNKFTPNDKKALAAKKAYSVTDDKNIFKYISWLPRFFELFDKIKRVRAIIKNVSAKCFFYQSKYDEMVSVKTLEILKENSNFLSVLLEKSAHYYYHEDDLAYIKREFERFVLPCKYLGKVANIAIDRPLGSVHPEFPSMVYPINYGYIPHVVGGDGEELDVYLLGVDEAVESFIGRIIGVVHRLNDDEDKLIAAPEGVEFTVEEIENAISFQEQYFNGYIEIYNNEVSNR